MPNELIFTVQPGAAQPAQPISLAEADLKERADLQEWVRNNPHILGDDVRIVTFEFAGWQARDGRAADRLDLLGLDSEGRLVVAELKRGPAPDTVEMQAIKYAAFASRFTPQTLAERHAEYLSRVSDQEVSHEDALAQLEEHVDGEFGSDLLREPRIVLMAASFPPQVTASAVWLTEMGIDIALIEFNAYRTANDIVLAVSQVWPVRDVEDFTVSPRQVERRVAEERARTRRETNAVITLVTEGTLDDGAALELAVDRLRPATAREPVTNWIAADPRRGRATWRNVRGQPLIWESDGETYSPTGLAKEIVERATGERPATLAGPSLWRTESDDTLASLAGFRRSRSSARFRADLHALLGHVRAGEWTTYGDLADAIGSSAQAVGQHITRCPEDGCRLGYRVLDANGRVSEGFQWGDPGDRRDPAEVLTEEGVAFIDGRADPVARLDPATLRGRM